ncbi:signal peptide containing protein [Theileria equi strain WA]|uniref:Signal peptide containing protein n=1 Tax=Theileria equi strain WA TaxID=1537102 RepID=L1LCK1_THEEQ|nr:signal peptide containing protein [Theileria equi strain WA]EKX73009.1 signal peptide containing protein [Theileria equi strain WA]|eukprot:XP_004832461.1 signal peptide containing protein [Theileria equi strain WA]
MRIACLLCFVTLLRLCSADCNWFSSCVGRNKKKCPSVVNSVDKSTLDISNPDQSIARLNSTDGKYKLYIPKDGNVITKVVDGTLTIWEGQENEGCKYIKVTLNNNQPRHVFIFTKGSVENLKYFDKNGNEWKEGGRPRDSSTDNQTQNSESTKSEKGTNNDNSEHNRSKPESI